MAESTNTKAKKVGGDLDALLRNLHLTDDEREGVFLAKEEREGHPKVKWMVVAKLLTVKDFSEASLSSTMRATWNTAREVICRPIQKNLFIVQVFCLGDWKRIMEDGPWMFRDCALMLEEFDGSTTIPKVLPHKVPAWIQLHKILLLYCSEPILKQLAGRVGSLITLEMKVVASDKGDFFRARVELEAERPLVRLVTLTPEGCESLFFPVRYEKIARFCAHYGLMGHVHLECGRGRVAVWGLDESK